MQTSYNGLPLPNGGEPIQYADGKFTIPDRPIIPFIEGDGTGRDIWRASQRVFDAAVEKAYGGKRSVKWFEVYAGEKAFREFKTWLPDETVNAARDLRVSIKGPLTTPVGGGIRSLNVALRQILDLYSCVRPVKYYAGVPSPVKHPEKLDVVIFRENTEDVYAGIEFRQGTPEAEKLIKFLNDDMLKGGKKKIRTDSGVGIKPISIFGTKRLVRRAIEYALEYGRKSVTLVHKGNIQKFTEGAFREWGYELAVEEFRDKVVTERESWILGNVEANPKLTVEENAALIEPGLEFGSEDFRKELYAEVKHVLDTIGKITRQRPMEEEGADQRPHRRLDLPAGDHPSRGVLDPRLPEPQRRLHLRRLRGAGGGPWHCAGSEHRRWLRSLRSHARYRAQVCGQGRDQSGIGDAVGCDDVRVSGLERGCEAD